MKRFMVLAIGFIIGLAVIFYGACVLVSNLKYDIDVYKKQNTTIQQQMTKMKNENTMLKQKTQMQAFGGSGIIRQAEIITTEKDTNNAVYGKFDLQLTVKNTTKKTINGLQVITQLIKSDPTKPLSEPEITTQFKGISHLAPGQTEVVTLKDFTVGAPTLSHEILISAAGFKDIKKLTVKVTTPPASATKQTTTKNSTRHTKRTTTQTSTTQQNTPPANNTTPPATPPATTQTPPTTNQPPAGTQ